MKTIVGVHTAKPRLAGSGVWPNIGFLVLSILLILIAAIEGGGMVQRGFSESKMLESDMGHKLLPSADTQSDSPISARVVHEGGPLIIGRPASNVSVAIPQQHRRRSPARRRHRAY